MVNYVPLFNLEQFVHCYRKRQDYVYAIDYKCKIKRCLRRENKVNINSYHILRHKEYTYKNMIKNNKNVFLCVKLNYQLP